MSKAGGLVVRRPGAFIDAKTKKRLWTAGEGNLPERVTITPMTADRGRLRRLAASTSARTGVPAYAGGITASGLGPPETITDYETFATANGSTGRRAVQIPNPAYAAWKAAQATAAAGNKTAVTNAQLNANSANASLLQQQQDDLAATKREQAGIDTAAGDTADIQGAAALNQRRRARDYQYDEFGQATPTEVNLQPGQNLDPNIPGVRASIRTREQVLAEAADRAAKRRGLNTQGAQIYAAQAGNAAARAGIEYNASLDMPHAPSAPSGAGDLTAKRSNYATHGEQAAPAPGFGGGFAPPVHDEGPQYNLGGSNVVARPGSGAYLAAKQHEADNQVVTDPFTGKETFAGTLRAQYSPDDLAIARAGHAVVQDPLTGEMTTRADLNARTDRYGNVVNKTGEYEDASTGNVFRNGRWENKVTHDYQIDANTWANAQDPTIRYHITNPKSGAGYWKTADGFILGEAGRWSNPVTGEVMINGQKYRASRPLRPITAGAAEADTSDEQSATSAW